MNWIDISRPLAPSAPTWPGDTPFHYEVSWPKSESGSVNVGKLTMSLHTGTHVDAPYHFDDDGNKILDLPIEIYIGPAIVLDVSGKQSVGAADLDGIDLTGGERLLLRTGSWPDPGRFPSDICYLRSDLAPFSGAGHSPDRCRRPVGRSAGQQGAAGSSQSARLPYSHFGGAAAGSCRAGTVRADSPAAAARPGGRKSCSCRIAPFSTGK